MEMKQEYSLGKIVKILFIIIITILVFYGITILVTKNQKNQDDNNTSNNTTIQYDEILIGNMYQKSDEEYYVLVELESDYSSLYSATYNYQQKGDKKIYTATLDNALNKAYYGEESNFDIKFPIFKESTLVKIQNGEIVEHYEGVESILKIISE